ncbi:MAG: 1,4-beta-xylanase [Planctomycetaceae bacterium]|nr:1,4-beta-xylanase [Planctomycetales bacterium]MCB9922836.1 1,4-beta-xylanase [Planctomycetaceae bacterium]
MTNIFRILPLFVGLTLVLPSFAVRAQDSTETKDASASRPRTDRPASKKGGSKQPEHFRWVNPLPKGKYPGVLHATFESPSMGIDVGYCIYLPPQYDEADREQDRFPVVYYLHGGRPGSETKSVGLATYIHEAISTGKVPPMIYVFVNGGEVSHYNYPEKNSMGEDVFVQELIPHVDKTYRTIADRRGRGIEGFSQGGRGTTRIMFKHPQLFCSAVPGGAGHSTEKSISENGGRESESLKFAPGYNTYDLAREYAKHPQPALKILIHVGTAGFNYQNNLEYMAFLRTLDIPFEALIVPEVPHSAKLIYEAAGLQLMAFHAKNFAAENR